MSKLSLKRKKDHLANRIVHSGRVEEPPPLNEVVVPCVVGLPNPEGDLCYINALVQALSHTLGIVETDESKDSQISGDASLASELIALLIRVASANKHLRHIQNIGACEKVVLPHSLALARALRNERPGDFMAGQQHDCAEAMHAILESLRNVKSRRDSRLCRLQFKSRAFEIASLFEGGYRAHLHCNQCERHSFR